MTPSGPTFSTRESASAEAPENAGAFYGRRKGKALRPGQVQLIEDVLPALRVQPGEGGRVDTRTLFAELTTSLTLEIGFGGGEHLAMRAREDRQAGFIGCEPFVNGMAKLLALVAGERLPNVRVWDRDAAELIAMLPDAALDRVYLLYPDPWPKRRQRKRRFVSDENLQALARVMRPGAELRFATDIDDYAGWALARVFRSADFRWAAQRADDWRVPWEGWRSTRYETKARREGRGSAYLTFTRI